MSEQIVILKNSPVKGKVPGTKNLQFGELAVNTNSGKLFTRRTDRVVDEVVSFGSDICLSQKVEVLSGTQITLDAQNRQVKELTLTSHTNMSIVGIPAANDMVTLTLIIFNDGDNAINWTNKIIWENGSAVSISNNSWTIIELFITSKKIFGVLKATNLKEV